MSYETDSWPYVPARWQTHWNTKREVRWVVIHDMEALETEKRARACAAYFATAERPGSAHVCVDDHEVIQCVRDNDQAAGAVGANRFGIHIEQPGFAKETAAEWHDEYSLATLRNVADVTAQYCLKYDLPVRKLFPADLKAGHPGICGHGDVSVAFPGTGHTDPGPNFPWDELIQLVGEAYTKRKEAIR
jgi:N-acetyl-anhydromuramyl-L-alanine amidase AmpD